MKVGEQMPLIDMNKLTGEALWYAGRIVRENGRLRASKPKGETMEIGCIKYVWRMVAFFISPKSRHKSMPMTADWDIPLGIRERGDKCKELDALVSQIVDAVPKAEWHGVRAWGNAFGVVGSPQLAEDGSIIYR